MSGTDLLNPNERPRFLTVDEAARLVGCSHWTVRVWIQKGRLTRYKCGTRTAVSRLELLGLLEQQETNIQNFGANL